MTFFEKLKKIIKKNNSLLCIGLDSNLDKINQIFNGKISQYEFNKRIVMTTYDLVCSYKINTAFYEAEGAEGILILKKTCDFIKKNFPQIPIIIDGKRGDIENSNNGYVKFIFNYLQADATTVNPYLGKTGLKLFLEQKEKGIFVLCKTSNLGSNEFQNLKFYLESDRSKDRILSLYLIVAKNVFKNWNNNKNCGLVVGANYPFQLKEIRDIIGEEGWFLVPGIGSQGGDLRLVLKNGLNKKREGLIINISRAIIFADKDFKKIREKTKEYVNLINFYKKF